MRTAAALALLSLPLAAAVGATTTIALTRDTLNIGFAPPKRRGKAPTPPPRPSFCSGATARPKIMGGKPIKAARGDTDLATVVERASSVSAWGRDRGGVVECTCTRIGPTECLTAAHCVTDPFTGRFDVESGQTLFLSNADEGTLAESAKALRVVAVYSHPLYQVAHSRWRASPRGLKTIAVREVPDILDVSLSTRPPAPDLAIIRFADPPPGPIAPVACDEGQRPPLSLTAIGGGCGNRENYAPMRVRPAQMFRKRISVSGAHVATKFAFPNHATKFLEDEETLFVTQINPQQADLASLADGTPELPYKLDGMTCPGDSGGPRLDPDGNVVAVSSGFNARAFPDNFKDPLPSEGLQIDARLHSRAARCFLDSVMTRGDIGSLCPHSWLRALDEIR